MSSSVLSSLASVSDAAATAGEEEDHEFRDAVITVLKANGVLHKIKAELRSSVFLALQQTSGAIKKKASASSRLHSLVSTSEGRLLCRLVHEFLVCAGLELTAAVFEPEAMLDEDNGGDKERQSILEDVGMPEAVLADKNAPILAEILRLSKVAILRSETPTLTDRSDPAVDEIKEEESSSSSRLGEKIAPSQDSNKPPRNEKTSSDESEKGGKKRNLDNSNVQAETKNKTTKNTIATKPKLTSTANAFSPGKSVHSGKPTSKLSSLSDLPPLKSPAKSSSDEKHGEEKPFQDDPKIDFQLGPLKQSAAAAAGTSNSSVSTEIEEDLGSLLNTSDDAMHSEEHTKDASVTEGESLMADYGEKV